MDLTVKNISYVTLSTFIRDIIIDQTYLQNRRYVFIVCYIKLPSVVRQGARGGPRSRWSRVQFPMVSLEFFIDIILPAAL
jgi:hypothetical protein